MCCHLGQSCLLALCWSCVDHSLLPWYMNLSLINLKILPSFVLWRSWVDLNSIKSKHPLQLSSKSCQTLMPITLPSTSCQKFSYEKLMPIQEATRNPSKIKLPSPKSLKPTRFTSSWRGSLVESATQEKDEFGITPVTALLVEDISLARKTRWTRKILIRVLTLSWPEK